MLRIKNLKLLILLNVLMNSAFAGTLEPLGKIHIPIGIPDSLDTLKTFVEAEGIFSPGFGSYGIYTWVYDLETNILYAPTQEKSNSERWLLNGSYPIPVTKWIANGLEIESIVSAVIEDTTEGKQYLTGYQVTVNNPGKNPRQILLYVALRPIGPAGFAINSLSLPPQRDALLVDGHPALIANQQPQSAGVLNTDTIGAIASKGELPKSAEVQSVSGDCSGYLGYDLVLESKSQTKLALFARYCLDGGRPGMRGMARRNGRNLIWRLSIPLLIENSSRMRDCLSTGRSKLMSFNQKPRTIGRVSSALVI